jgi:uncharacterized phage-associated protein
MSRPVNREKLLHAIIFFTKETRHCHKLKIFKLLFFLDFELYRQTGRTVTGLEYFAWKMGPVPRKLFEEFGRPLADMDRALSLRTESGSDPGFSDGRLHIAARIRFDEQRFTRRELDTMAQLAEIYRDATGDQMRAASHDGGHAHGRPWHEIYEVRNQPQELIPYSLALDSRPDSISSEQAALIEEEEREWAALAK